MKQLLLITMLFVLLTTTGMSQENYWQPYTSAKSQLIPEKAVGRLAYPKEYKLYDLDISPLKFQLLAITETALSNSSTIVSLPNAYGTMEQFSVTESSNFELSLFVVLRRLCIRDPICTFHPNRNLDKKMKQIKTNLKWNLKVSKCMMNHEIIQV